MTRRNPSAVRSYRSPARSRTLSAPSRSTLARFHPPSNARLQPNLPPFRGRAPRSRHRRCWPARRHLLPARASALRFRRWLRLPHAPSSARSLSPAAWPTSRSHRHAVQAGRPQSRAVSRRPPYARPPRADRARECQPGNAGADQGDRDRIVHHLVTQIMQIGAPAAVAEIIRRLVEQLPRRHARAQFAQGLLQLCARLPRPRAQAARFLSP